MLTMSCGGIHGSNYICNSYVTGYMTGVYITHMLKAVFTKVQHLLCSDY